VRKGLRAATGGGIYDLIDAQASRQDQSVQAQNREEQPYPGAMSQALPGMARGGRVNWRKWKLTRGKGKITPNDPPAPMTHGGRARLKSRMAR